jgi:glycosyltransferase involved in cell wall biosynthesis
VIEPFVVAAVIPARDALPDVLEAVESVLAQTRPPAEVLVVDDSSRDGTGAAVEERFAGDRRAPVRVLRGRFGSASAARNAGWRAAGAPWIALLDADDVWEPDKLEQAAAVLARAPGAAWFFSDGSFRTLRGELHPSWFALYADLPEDYVGTPVAELLEVNFVLTSSVVVRRDALELAGGFDETLSHAEDLDLWIRLARRWPVAASQRALVRYQHRDGGLSGQYERRLRGDVELFSRLAADPTLPGALRRRALQRNALAHHHLAIAALRGGNGALARRHLRGSRLLPKRALPFALTFLASLLPPAWLAGLRRLGWATRPVGRLMVSQHRVRLHGVGEGER